MKLNTYQDWRTCIEVHCGIPLTAEFIEERLAELTNGGHPKTAEFARLYGAEHLQRTIGWFERASDELVRSE
ncbi:MAG: hypothetical protein AAFU73_04640 [Planctomycetota bacterium]